MTAPTPAPGPTAEHERLLNDTIISIAKVLPDDNRVALSALAYALAGAAVALGLPLSSLLELVQIAHAEEASDAAPQPEGA